MKKNISINISGIIFHIEEDGYDTLRKYLDSVNSYFASFEDNSEILADIESRIAEIFLSKLNDGKQVITAEDVQTLIATMGSVSDFKAAEEQEFAGGAPAAPRQETKSNYSKNKRLVRDAQRKILGGVCAGLAHYFSVDPVWPRVLLALLTIGTSGIFLIVYVVMWIVLPAEQLEDEPAVKKMYRDPDKKVIGGVGAGVAAFFGADIALARVLFVLLAFFGGVGILLYIVLWIALPEARTITEKMEMQGEPVTLSNIESTVKKGLNEKESEEESTLSKIILFPFRALAAILNALAGVLGPVLKMFVDVLRVAIGLVFSLTGLAMIISLIFAFAIVLGLINAPDWQLFSDWYISTPNVPLNAFRNSFPTWMLIFTFLVAIIPAFLIMLLGNSIIAKKIIFNAAVGWTLFVTFFVSLLVVGFSLPQLVYAFKETGELRREQIIPIPAATAVFHIKETGLDDYNVTSITLRPYAGTDLKVVERFQSQGPSRKVAAENAQMVDYTIIAVDSTVTFDSNITFKPDAKFRAQRLDLDVYVPVNKKLVIDAALWRLIDTDIISDGSYRQIMLNEETQTWQVNEKGITCASCPPAPEYQEQEKENIDADVRHSELRDFSSLDLKGMFDVRIERGDDFAVDIDGDESERRRYDVYVNGETLVVDFDDDKRFWKRNLLGRPEIRIRITMPALKNLDIAGAGKLRFSGFNEESVNIEMTGAVSAEGDIDSDKMTVKLTGASSLELNGHGQFLQADIVGASGLKAYGYEVSHAVISARGASSARVNAVDRLEIDKGVASTVSHKGNPEIIKD
jgi:phage shock protein PspC (stress-responsive transcriptional regulator)